MAQVRERVQQDWQDEQRQTLNEKFYESLRAEYDVIIEDTTLAERLASGGDD